MRAVAVLLLHAAVGMLEIAWLDFVAVADTEFLMPHIELRLGVVALGHLDSFEEQTWTCLASLIAGMVAAVVLD